MISAAANPKMPDIKAVGLTILSGRTAPRAHRRCICATPDRRQNPTATARKWAWESDERRYPETGTAHENRNG